MLGERSIIRIGVLVPEGNTVHEREFAVLRPANVEFRFGYFLNPSPGNPKVCADLAQDLDAPMQALKEWGAQIILLGCTTASMLCSSEAFRIGLETRAGLPIVTAASASIAAMKALNTPRLAVATPYGPVSNQIVRDFLESQGGEVVALEGLALDRSPEIWRNEATALTAAQMLDFVLKVDTNDTAALYMPCTAINVLDAIGPFEAKTGKPAFTSVQAGFWATLRQIGVDGRQRGYGRLIEQWDF